MIYDLRFTNLQGIEESPNNTKQPMRGQRGLLDKPLELSLLHLGVRTESLRLQGVLGRRGHPKNPEGIAPGI
jgi:hypothetical protein